MKKLNWKHILGAVLLSIVLTSVTLLAIRIIPQYMKTDFGNYSGSSDYGGFGGGWSGGGYSGGGWGGYGGYGDYGGYGGGSIILYPGYGFGMAGGGIFIFYLILFLLIMYMRQKGSSQQQTHIPQTQTTQSARALQAALADLKARDPGFSESAFLEDAANLYIRLQNAWTDRNLEPVRARLSEEQYAAAQRGVEQFLRNRQTNHVDRIAVLGTEIIGCGKDNRNDIIKVRMSTRIVDYVTDDATGRLVSGSNSREKFMTYHWTLIRSLGKQTAVSGTIKAKFCPHCGAPLDLNQSGVCPYCHSVLTSDDHDWVLTKIEGVSQRTV